VIWVWLGVALIRILVDGYSMLHGCPQIAPGRARHSARAREELIFLLTHYRDMAGTPITVVFDGGGAPSGTPQSHSTPEMEILFSKAGQTADDIIERVAYRLKEYGDVLVVTDDLAERETVLSAGGMASTCAHFLAEISQTLDVLQSDMKHRNRREQTRFKRPAFG